MNAFTVVHASVAWRRLGKRLPWIVLPGLILGFQLAARMVAEQLRGVAFDWGWISIAAQSPWLWIAVACEAASLSLWMTILSEASLSAAFPMTAVAYALVIGVSWVALREPFAPLDLVGSVCILSGIYLIGRDADGGTP